jgi:glycosyltransferase involved in cell wall biosynthesis
VRILVATYRRGLMGGAEKYLQSVIPGLIQHGHSVGLLCEHPSSPGEERIDSQADGMPYWCLSELGLDALLLSLEAWAPDIVYSHGLEDFELERRLLERYPMALYAHTYHGTCISGRKCHVRPRLQPCSRQLGVGCLALYYPLGCGGLHPGTAWRMFQVQSKRKRSLPHYQAVLVASRHMYREFAQHGVRADRLRLLPLYSTDSVPQTSPPLPKDPGGRILFVGRLVDVKGVDRLIEAMSGASRKLGRPLSLTIAGDGSARGALRVAALRSGVAVEFAGWVNTENKLRLVRQADLVAVPSLWPEPFGLVGIEAGCFGVPAVGFDVGGISDWLVPGQTGELAPGDPPTAAGLTDAIVRALADPGHYSQLSVGAWEMAKRFNIERHIEQLEQILTAGTAAMQPIPATV